MGTYSWYQRYWWCIPYRNEWFDCRGMNLNLLVLMHTKQSYTQLELAALSLMFAWICFNLLSKNFDIFRDPQPIIVPFHMVRMQQKWIGWNFHVTQLTRKLNPTLFHKDELKLTNDLQPCIFKVILIDLPTTWLLKMSCQL